MRSARVNKISEVEREPARTVVVFGPDWTQWVEGILREGEAFVIEYHSARMPDCRITYRGSDWWMGAHVRFHPASDVVTTRLQPRVRATAESPNPIVNCELTIPSGTTRLEMWFENTDYSGCQAWDSRYGQNYVFDAEALKAMKVRKALT